MNPEEEPGLSRGEEDLVGLDTGPVPGVTEEPHREKQENPVVAWARAIAFGLRDTANDVLDAGREGAQEKSTEMWGRFRQKTRERRARD